MKMKWSGQQEAALKAVAEWLKNGTKTQQVFRLFGFAGTGKTTLAQHMAAMVKGQVNYASLSGKAASVLRSKGCTGAQTIHSLIYRPFEDGKKLTWILRGPDTDSPSPLCASSLLILDEVSMVDEKLANDLLSFGVPILAIGDPAQLPPVEGGGYFTHPDITPDIMLSEIHRQAKGNPIIDMATRVREGDLLSIGDYGEGNCVVSPRDYDELMIGADQVLCGTHRKRQKFNRMIRRFHGVDHDVPLPNDKLICLSNDREQRQLLNGTQWYVKRMLQRTANQISGGVLPMTVWSDDDENVTANITTLEEMFEFKTPKQIADLRKSVGFQQFDYGYAITVHKAQGSQWNNVVVFDDSWTDRDDPKFQFRWLYTALTRAAERVTIIGSR